LKIEFYKYHGTGNDFILLDNRTNNYGDLTKKQIAFLCDRHFGIGADGLMMLELSNDIDFKMIYFNSDGGESSMCGNGGRCITLFAKHLEIIETEAIFKAIDGLHYSIIDDDNMVELKMQDVSGIQQIGSDFVTQTGSPHYVRFIDNAQTTDVVTEGKLVRYNDTYKKEGINVNFAQVVADKTLFVSTYERGVEAETLSCGTGVTASALAQIRDNIGSNIIRVQTKGGTLMVKCVNEDKQNFTDIYLCGPAQLVFKGEITI
jgi:diaminopimelate epimerase